jgi:MFS family permease
VFDTYRAVFRAPGTAAFCAAGFVMRMSIAIYPIGLVLLVAIRTGHYGQAGLLSGAYVLGAAIGGPLLARLVDRHGQARLILPSTAVHVAAVAALVAMVLIGLPTALLAVPAVVMGFSYLSVGSLVRARWSYALAGRPELGTAYSLESILDEVIFVVGPIIASVLAVQVDPVWVLVVGGVLVAVGAVSLSAQRHTEPPAHMHADGPHRPALAYRGMPLLTVAMFGMGGIFGSVEVVMAAFVGQHHERSRTGLVLALFALGSGVAGLLYGARHWAWPLRARYCLQSVLFAALIPLLLAADSVPQLAVIAFVVGLGIAPTLITSFGMVEQLVPPRGLTEGLAWLNTGLNVGYGLLAAVVGAVADRHGAHLAFWVSVGAGLFTATAAAALTLWLGRVPRRVVTAE